MVSQPLLAALRGREHPSVADDLDLPADMDDLAEQITGRADEDEQRQIAETVGARLRELRAESGSCARD